MSYEKRDQEAWQVVCDAKGQRVRRFAVPSGWLYQVELQNYTEAPDDSRVWHEGWHPPVFIQDSKP